MRIIINRGEGGTATNGRGGRPVVRWARRGSAVTASAAGLVLLVGCGSSSPGAGTGVDRGTAQPRETVFVVASTDVWGDVVGQVSRGTSVEVTSIISDPDADPHSYEADSRNQLALSKADLVIENGGGYDDFVDTMLKAADNPHATLLNAVAISGHTAAAGGELNEHVWYDFPTVGEVAERIADALAKADPTDAATFHANADTFLGRLRTLEKAEAAVRAVHAGDGAAITEPVPLYLLQACGLVDKTPEQFSEAIEEGTDVSAGVLKQTLDLFSAHRVKVLAYNEQTSGPETDKILEAAKAANVPVVPVTETLPAGKDYLTWMHDNVTAIQTALGAAR